MLVVAAFILVAIGMDLLLGGYRIEPAHALLTTLAAACVVLPASPRPASSATWRCSDTAS